MAAVSAANWRGDGLLPRREARGQEARVEPWLRPRSISASSRMHLGRVSHVLRVVEKDGVAVVAVTHRLAQLSVDACPQRLLARRIASLAQQAA